MHISFCFLALVALVAAAPYPQSTDDPSEDPSDEPPDVPVSISETIVTSTVAIPFSTSLNIPVTATSVIPTSDPDIDTTSTSRKRNSHWEPVPIFSKECDCPALATARYPCWATDALQKCNFEELHSFVCWTSANFGCPSPTRSCENLYTPTPVTGRHPCELGQNTGNPPAVTGTATLL